MPQPIANRTRLDCTLYANGASLNVDVTGTIYRSPCAAIAASLNVGTNLFQSW